MNKVQKNKKLYEFRIDENKNKETPSNDDINRYILKRSYELFERIIKKYFNEKIYEENYMKKYDRNFILISDNIWYK